MKTFSRDGVCFAYPAGWKLDLDDAGSGWTVTVESPGTAFAVVSLRPDADGVGEVAAETLTTLRSEYPGLDVEEVTATLAGSPAVGHDLQFLTIDTVVTVRSRVADTTAGPLLVLTQVGEHDAGEYESVLAAVVASVQVAE